MTHREKVDHFIAEMEQRGVGKSTTVPPAFRLAWRLGSQSPSPHFMGFGRLAWIAGAFFGLFWGLAMWMTVWRSAPWWLSASAAVAAGVMFGVFMAAYCRRASAKYGMPT